MSAAEVRDIEVTAPPVVLIDEAQYVEKDRPLDMMQGYRLSVKDVAVGSSNKIWVELSYTLPAASGAERTVDSFVMTEGDSFLCYRMAEGKKPVLVLSASFSKTYLRDESSLIEFYPFTVYADPYVGSDSSENMKWVIVSDENHDEPAPSSLPSAAPDPVFSVPSFSFLAAVCALFAAAGLLKKSY